MIQIWDLCLHISELALAWVLILVEIIIVLNQSLVHCLYLLLYMLVILLPNLKIDHCLVQRLHLLRDISNILLIYSHLSLNLWLKSRIQFLNLRTGFRRHIVILNNSSWARRIFHIGWWRLRLLYVLHVLVQNINLCLNILRILLSTH